MQQEKRNLRVPSNAFIQVLDHKTSLAPSGRGHITVPGWLHSRRLFVYVVSASLPPQILELEQSWHSLVRPLKFLSNQIYIYMKYLVISGITTSLLLESTLLRFGRDRLTVSGQ